MDLYVLVAVELKFEHWGQRPRCITAERNVHLCQLSLVWLCVPAWLCLCQMDPLHLFPVWPPRVTLAVRAEARCQGCHTYYLPARAELRGLARVTSSSPSTPVVASPEPCCSVG